MSQCLMQLSDRVISAPPDQQFLLSEFVLAKVISKMTLGTFPVSQIL
ncbi:hypothetical protein Pse7429DRAFT_0528 [Pseudanabaena biceps PCC 7429]|uniref:Uncharacterized protein n=1 Tax=Pseudanabaena biceps PCC 7429 TaxID=927668 RepID=L8MRY6_9CYAN|nr:hypothetical protein Pse7429DRAFT_4710 [Pseudanabaena biceps PCC 7429]ELS34236.1 hypothetical protein Pse7429DRAFT_0528 [Pseudanabaena biceps PCC 7429]